MNTQMIELDGLEIEVASELYCDRGGNHHELADRARTDRKQLGHNLDESAVLCWGGLKTKPPKRGGRGVWMEDPRPLIPGPGVRHLPPHHDFCGSRLVAKTRRCQPVRQLRFVKLLRAG